MTHIDEGTIHAWLDGALPPSEAAAVEAHVGACARCAAQVAEARGFLAGASRILSALDDVPAGVIPERVPEVARAKPKRRWLRPTGWAVAAGVMLAVGMMTVKRQPAAPLTAALKPATGNQSPVAPPATAAVPAGVAGTKVAAKAPFQPDVAPASISPHTETLNTPVKTQPAPTAAGAAVAEAPRRTMGLERSGVRLDAVVTASAGDNRLTKDAAQLGVRPVCYTDGARVLMLDTSSVAGDDRARLAVRDTSGVVGEWQRMGADSVVLRIARPAARTVWGVTHDDAVDFSGAGMVTASCETLRR